LAKFPHKNLSCQGATVLSLKANQVGTTNQAKAIGNEDIPE